MKSIKNTQTSGRLGCGNVPLVWLLQGHRTGDNLQVEALADGLGWPQQTKILKWHRNWVNRPPQWTPFYGRFVSLKHLTSDAREGFNSPWPDVVLSIGWRSVPVARWIKNQSGARLVHLGRPRAPLSYFDLVLTTPQYRLPRTNNVVHLTGPLTTVSPDTHDPTANKWAARFAHLPRPWTAVLVGGDTPTLKFSSAATEALAQAVDQHTLASGGSLIIVTSPRTPQRVTNILRNAIQAEAFVHEWTKGAENPYAAVLAIADQFIVTNDSISMTHEAALTGRPVQIFALTSKEALIDRALRSVDYKMRSADTAMGKTYQGLIRNGVIYPPKSPEDYFQQLVKDGRASRWGEVMGTGASLRVEPENVRAVQAVRALFDPKDIGFADNK
ncbi:mitochondrial fission ELM1 family protein [Octadecabacter sp.]|nr:mitochondrial fission ELM1 family protein [Octadecabacter sp.]